GPTTERPWNSRHSARMKRFVAPLLGADLVRTVLGVRNAGYPCQPSMTNRRPMKTYSAIKAEIDKLERAAQKALKSERSGVIQRIKDAIAVYGLTAQDFGLAGGRNAKKTKTTTARATVGVAKYRDPVTGRTWTGRGKPPNWIVGAKDRSAF